MHDIIASIEAIEVYTKGITESDFSGNQMLQDAVTRRFEIIGKAATHISQNFKTIHPEIEWRLMTDMRNKLIHDYFGVSPSTIFQTIHSNLPDLKDKIAALI